MKEAFDFYNFTPKVQARIDLANQVLTEYRAAGYRLTIRQLYYQLVARGHIPNNMRSYKRTVADMTKGRMAGLVDWDGIEDRTRHTMTPPQWDNHVDPLRALRDRFRLDRWQWQPNHVELMIEKEALSGVFSPLVAELHVNITSNRGYSSASEMWRHAKRLRYLHNYHGKSIHLFYFGDHDPSGMDMDRDISERIGVLSNYVPLEFSRLALTWGQIQEYDPPPNPAKLTDSRAGAYIAAHGFDSWELDALQPQVLAGLARNAVLALRDDEIYDQVLEIEEEMRSRYQDSIDKELADWDIIFGHYDWPHEPWED